MPESAQEQAGWSRPGPSIEPRRPGGLLGMPDTAPGRLGCSVPARAPARAGAARVHHAPCRYGYTLPGHHVPGKTRWGSPIPESCILADLAALFGFPVAD